MADPIKRIELKNGVVRYRFKTDAGRDPITGKRKQTELTFDTKREAQAEWARIKHQVHKGTYVPASKATVNEELDEYLASATRDVEKATAANYRDALLPVRERFGDRRIQSLTENDVRAFVDWMLTAGRRRGGKPGTGLSVRTVRLTLGRLRAALDDAVRRQRVVRNVALHVTIPRSALKAEKETKPPLEPWTAAEIKAFLSGIKGDRLYAVMLLSLMGLRPAETCGLRWCDVNADAGVLAVGDNTRTIADGQVEEKGAKSEKGHRGLPLPTTAAVALKAFKAQQAAERLASGQAYTDTGYVLVDEVGQPVKTDWLRRRMYKLMDSAGVRKVRPYDARHACLTYLATNGVSDVVVSAWAGHADLSFTKRFYVHPDHSHLQGAAAELDKMLG